MSSSATSDRVCAVCQASGGGGNLSETDAVGATQTLLRRCANCQSRWYCSRNCQAQDWKRHKRACRLVTQQKKAAEAWKELQEIVVNTTPEEASQTFHRAKDEMTALQLSSSSSLPVESSQNVTRSQHSEGPQKLPVTDSQEFTESNKNKTVQRQKIIPKSTSSDDTKEILPSSDSVQEDSEAAISTSWEEQDQLEQTEITHPYFDFYVEHLPHLSSYQIDVQPRTPKTDPDAVNTVENWSIKLLREENDGISTLYLYNAIVEQTLVLRLEGLVQPTVDSISEQRGRTSIRLSFEGDCEPIISPRVTSKAILNNLACAGCGTCLVANTENDTATPRIQRVLPLPSGIWDEMTDYLICFEGQPSIDFTSSTTKAQPGVVLEDDSVLVYHLPDVAPHVQVLAIPGYGEGEEATSSEVTATEQLVPRAAPLMRGTRMWSDVVGGATVACSCCCCVLGVAPVELPDTVRFFKHRIHAGGHDRKNITSTLKFCIQSMAKYAESKAIFSFVIRPESQPRQGIILQLLGWDRKAAKAFKKGHHNDLSSHQRLAWSRVAKVLFEERTHLPIEAPSSSPSPLNFAWVNGGDWCCPPGTLGNVATHEIRDEKKTNHASELPSSYVSLWIDAEEWESFRADLQAAQETFTREVFTAAFLAKNGRLPASDSFSGLAAVFLD